MVIVIKALLKVAVNNFVWIGSSLIPKTKKIIIVGGWLGNRFADNSKAMYLFMSQNKQKLGIDRVFFVSRDKEIVKQLNENGYEALMCNSLASIWFHLRAKSHIIDDQPPDLNRFFSIKAKRINLWHGFPLKKIGYYRYKDISNEAEAITRNNSLGCRQIGNWQSQYLVAYSDEFAARLRYAFGQESKFIILGVSPRIVYMLGEIARLYLPSEFTVFKKIETLRKQNKKIIFYLPTFRNIPESNDQCIADALSLESFLERNDLYLLVKLHIAAVTSGAIAGNSKRIVNLPPQSDVYNFLDQSDVLVTDYSSVYYDYLLFAGRSMIFYCFDLEVYKNTERGFFYSYHDFTPGDKVTNLEALQNAILRAITNPDSYNMPYESLKKQMISLIYDNRPHTADELYRLCQEVNV